MTPLGNVVGGVLLLCLGFGIGVLLAPKKPARRGAPPKNALSALPAPPAPAVQPPPLPLPSPAPAPVLAPPPAPVKPPIAAPAAQFTAKPTAKLTAKPTAKPTAQPTAKPKAKSKAKPGTAKRRGAHKAKAPPGGRITKRLSRLTRAKPIAPLAQRPQAKPALKLHPNLIPQDVKIVRCYYAKDVVGPGAKVGLDINGAGFNAAFREIISIDTGSPDVVVAALSLVTANHIHAELDVSQTAKTAYSSAKIMIKGLPVFQADEPLAVVRPAEVLDVKILGIGADGRTARFRAITNLPDPNMSRQFWVESTVEGLSVESLDPQPPHYVDGTLAFQDARLGKYGVRIALFSKQVYRNDDIGVIVPSNIGTRGRTQKIVAEKKHHRPGDSAVFSLLGNNFAPKDVKTITARIEGLKTRAALSYVSPTEIRIAAKLPPDAKEGSYGVIVEGPDNKVVQRDAGVFSIVPAQWVGDIRIEPQAKPGGSSTVRISGRDFTSQFASSLAIETDDFDLKFSGLRLQDASTMVGELSIGANVKPGDYLLRLSAAGKPVKPQAGAIITVQ